MRGRFVALGVLATAALALTRWASAGGAQDPQGIAVRWVAPPGCPDEAFVRAEVARLLAGSRAPADRLEASAEVAVAAAGGWRVHLRTHSATADGERVLGGESCRAIAETTALIVAMAVDPDQATANDALARPGATDGAPSDGDAGVAVDGEPGAAPPPGPDAASASETEASSTPRAPPPAAWLLAAGAEGDLGALPSAGAAPALMLAWRPHPFRFDLSGAYFAPVQAPVAGGGTATFVLVSASAHGCYELGLGRLGLGPCVGGELSSIGASTNLSAPSSGNGQWLSLVGGGLLSFAPVDRLELDLRLDAEVPLLRPDFQVDGASVHRPSVVTGRALLAFGARF